MVLTLLLIIPIVYSASVGIDELFTIDGSDIKNSEGTTTFFYAGLNLVATNKEEIEYHYLDGIGSNVKGRHLPFGQELRDANERFEFTGKELDDDSGLNYFNARYYDPSIGRFLSVDPKEDEPPYQYVYNNPMNYVDPTGRGGFKKGWAKFLKFFGIDIDDAAKHADDAARAAARQTDDEIDAFMDDFADFAMPDDTPSSSSTGTSPPEGDYRVTLSKPRNYGTLYLDCEDMVPIGLNPDLNFAAGYRRADKSIRFPKGKPLTRVAYRHEKIHAVIDFHARNNQEIYEELMLALERDVGIVNAANQLAEGGYGMEYFLFVNLNGDLTLNHRLVMEEYFAHLFSGQMSAGIGDLVPNFLEISHPNIWKAAQNSGLLNPSRTLDEINNIPWNTVN